jgi:methionyl-tRNA synthetase
LAEVWVFIRRCNKYIDENAPWEAIKRDETKPVVARVLYNLAEALRVVAILITPVMPNIPAHIYNQLNITEAKHKTLTAASAFGLLDNAVTITKGEVIFPRIDTKNVKTEEKAGEKAEIKVESKPEITIDDFAKMELKVGTVIECEPVKKSDKLLKSQIRIGGEVRQVVSGIAAFYTPEQLVGKKVVVVTNLKPVKIRGEMSCGMILAASTENDGELNIVTVDGDIPDGSAVR